MKFSFYSGFNLILKEYGIEEAAKRAVDLGFSGVEFCLRANPCTPIETAKEYRRVLDKYNLVTSCYTCATSIVDLATPDLLNEESVRLLCGHLDAAAILGAPVFHHTICFSMKLDGEVAEYDRYLKTAVNGCKTVAKYAARYGIKVIYEPQGYVFNGVEGLGPLLESLKAECDNVGICGDTGNTLFFDEFADALFEKYPKDILNVHLKDMVVYPDGADNIPENYYISRTGKKMSEVPIGTGDIDLEGIFRILKEAGYDGYYSIENFNAANYKETTKKNMENILKAYSKVFG